MALARAVSMCSSAPFGLDRTLNEPRSPPIESPRRAGCRGVGVSCLRRAGGGWFSPRQLSELVGPRRRRTSLLLLILASSTARGDLVAVVDAARHARLGSARQAGVDLDAL